MNREILYRGKQIVSGEWIYGVPISNDNITCIFKLTDGLSELKGFQVKTETVGQYTGLTDRNGKKIFEGDIIKSKGKKAFAVEYSQNIAGFVTKGFGILSCPCMNVGTMKSYEVIGNIYDNPELMEGTDNELDSNN